MYCFSANCYVNKGDRNVASPNKLYELMEE